MRVPPGTLCLIPRGATLAQAKPCGKPADRLVQISCEHGHTSTKIVCGEHCQHLTTNRGPGRMLCQRCKTIDGHDCPVVAKEDTSA